MSSEILKYGLSIVDAEITSLKRLSNNLSDSLENALKIILECKGRVVVSGMGKSGLIGKKISATLSSTGTPSFFLHPAEALHGDLGMIRKEDVLLSISNSGASEEILRIIPFIQTNGNNHITLVGKQDSLLAKNADVVLDISIDHEACPLQLAPMSSTTCTLVMGDILAASLMKLRGFKAENFAEFHPAGALGRKLLSKVGDEMRKENLPVVFPDTPAKEVIYTISHGQLGLCVVIENDFVVGLITDGDLRRTLEKNDEGIFDLVAKEIMTENPVVVSRDLKISEAEQIIKEKRIKALLVTDKNRLEGVFEYNGVI